MAVQSISITELLGQLGQDFKAKSLKEGRADVEALDVNIVVPKNLAGAQVGEVSDGLLIVCEVRGQFAVVVILPTTSGRERCKRNCMAIVIVVDGSL